ncbi:divergent PAP2 family protein [bacterium]|nr:divergent PAP2 family protein [bacterium]
MFLEAFKQTIANNGYEVLTCGILAAFTGQIIKFILFTIKTRKINFKIFTTTGGMPSTHSAGVMALSTIIGILKGFDSIEFAIAFGYALIIMYDAAGLRRAAGKTAASLNKMMEEFYNHDLRAVGGKLKELLGHTPFEVFVGAIYGIWFAYMFHLYFIG